MSFKDILTQLELTYGQPDAAAILVNDNLLRLPFQATNAPKALFYRLEQCQEVAVIAINPYSVAQMTTMAVRLLCAANIFPLKDFKDWEAVPAKMLPALKTFFHTVFTKQMTAIILGHTSGCHSYTNANRFNIFNMVQGSDLDSPGGKLQI